MYDEREANTLNANGTLPAAMNDTKPSHAAGIIHYRVLDEMVVYRPGSAQAASLNESAGALWELCDGERSLDQMCIQLGARYGLAPDELQDDVRNAVLRLCELGLLCR